MLIEQREVNVLKIKHVPKEATLRSRPLDAFRIRAKTRPLQQRVFPYHFKFSSNDNSHHNCSLPITATMIRSDFSRVDSKRRAALDHKKTQFAKPQFKEQDYVHSLNFYEIPPTTEITLEEFEVWAINRLKGV